MIHFTFCQVAAEPKTEQHGRQPGRGRFARSGKHAIGTIRSEHVATQCFGLKLSCFQVALLFQIETAYSCFIGVLAASFSQAVGFEKLVGFVLDSGG